MPVFRANEALEKGTERLRNYLVPRDASPAERTLANEFIDNALKTLGPAVESYPSWHPLVNRHKNKNSPSRWPSEDCGYLGLDHTRYFAHGFITCPYGDAKRIIDSVENLKGHFYAEIVAEEINLDLYASGTTPVMVTCDWNRPLGDDFTVPANLAIPLMLEQELPMWEWAERGENWETMRPYFLGEPHGSRSSLFVNQDTALMMKRLWSLLNESGMYGPVKGR